LKTTPLTGSLLRAFLNELYEIVEYETGIAALEAFATQLPDLVLLDISLPGMDGLAVIARIRSDERLKKLPVVALTAHAMHGDRERFMKSGFDDYVSKPIVDEQVLLNAIRRLLERA
jgi:CheY-like chemotaxis protein